jgi:hypothetical protein
LVSLGNLCPMRRPRARLTAADRAALWVARLATRGVLSPYPSPGTALGADR